MIQNEDEILKELIAINESGRTVDPKVYWKDIREIQKREKAYFEDWERRTKPKKETMERYFDL